MENFEELHGGLHIPDPQSEVLVDALKQLSILVRRLGEAEGMLLCCATILKHGDTQEVKTSEKIFAWLEKKK